jgi:hypothetical protein
MIVGCVGIALLGASGCENPNGNGVQDYGTIVGRLLDDRTGQPLAVSPVYVSVGATTVSQVDTQGGFVISRVPIGKQTVNVNAIGYRPFNVDVRVVKNETSDAGYLRLTPAVGP